MKTKLKGKVDGEKLMGTDDGEKRQDDSDRTEIWRNTNSWIQLGFRGTWKQWTEQAWEPLQLIFLVKRATQWWWRTSQPYVLNCECLFYCFEYFLHLFIHFRLRFVICTLCCHDVHVRSGSLRPSASPSTKQQLY